MTTFGLIPPPEDRQPPDPLRDPAVALKYTCPYCTAEPGQPCVNMTGGGAMELPHYSRTPAAVPP